MPAGTGNARKKVLDESLPPWLDDVWGRHEDGSLLTRGERCIKFITTYCVVPKGHGAGKPMDLAPFQRRLILRWFDTPDTRSAMMSIPRGNGKSTLMAAVALWALHDFEHMPDVPVIATTLKQAMKTIYKPAASMNAKSPELASRTIAYTGIGDTRLFVPWNEGNMYPLASDIESLQGLDPTLGIVDEVGFVDVDCWDAMELTSGKRDSGDSIVIGCGTPNVIAEGALWERRKLWLEGIKTPGFLFDEFAAPEGCAIDDESLWYPANPALAAGFLAIDALRSAVAVTREAPFRVFRLGQWANAKDGWLPIGQFEKCRVSGVDLEPDGSAVMVAVDMALKHDSTAVVASQRQIVDGVERVVGKSWVLDWAGDIADYEIVMGIVREVHRGFPVEAVGFDPAYFQQAAQTLMDEGLPMVEFGQGAGMMVPAAQTAFVTVCSTVFAHDFDMESTKQVIAAEAKPSGEAWRLTKGVRAKSRNDCAIALVMSLFLLIGTLVDAYDPLTQLFL